MAQRAQFEALALPHLTDVYRAAIALCADATLAEDLAQATYLKAWQRFETFALGTSIRAWLMRILRNTWIDELRRRQVTGTVLPLEEQLLPPGPDGPDDAGPCLDPSALLERLEDEQVIRAFRRLSSDQRLALTLVDVEGYSLTEAAAAMDVPVGTVKSRCGRARQALRRLLAGFARDRRLVEPER